MVGSTHHSKNHVTPTFGLDRFSLGCNNKLGNLLIGGGRILLVKLKCFPNGNNSCSPAISDLHFIHIWEDNNSTTANNLLFAVATAIHYWFICGTVNNLLFAVPGL